MATAKLIALLREVQEAADSVDGLGYDLSLRIDAALAEAEARAKRAAPEWAVWDTHYRLGPVWKIWDFPAGVQLTVMSDWPGAGFSWSVDRIGLAHTEDEAKAMAVEYARRLP